MFQEWEMGVVDLVKLKGNFYLFYEIIFSLFSENRELEELTWQWGNFKSCKFINVR